MRKLTRWSLAVLALAGVAGGGAAWMMAMPGEAVPAPPVVEVVPEQQMAARLRQHVTTIAGERNWRKREALEAAARYIEGQMQGMGYKLTRQAVPSKSGTVYNLEARLDGAGDTSRGLVVIGAHYDSAEDTVAANDNGSGVAVLLELARAFAGQRAAPGYEGVRLVFFVNEEPPYFQTEMMGSLVYAKELAVQKKKVAAMYSLETMGAYYDGPGTQRYPMPGLNHVYPDVGNFLGFISDTGARDDVRAAVGAFRATRRLPSEGIAAPAALEGIDWSDHWSFRSQGYPGVMVTDTAPFRYEHYHTMQDTPDKIDFQRLAKATLGLRDMSLRLYLAPAGAPSDAAKDAAKGA
jgi:hypothetical protein